MKTESEKFKELIGKYTDGTASDEEVAWIESVYLKWNERSNRVHTSQSLREADQLMWANIVERLELEDGRPHPGKQVFLWKMLQVTAAVILLIGVAFFFFKDPNRPTSLTKVGGLSSEILPGRNTAILTLANGKSIQLSEAKTGVVIDASQITYSDGTTVSSAAGQVSSKKPGMTTISTPRGGQYQVELPDGSKVWMNAASTLRFPESFEGSPTRMVELIGEAYFEVSSNREKPFIVKSSSLETKVLGTHFNVTNYDDDTSVKITLQEGRVEVKQLAKLPAGQKPEHILLRPNQQVIVERGAINLKEVDAEEVIAWKNGKFVFSSEDLGTIMRKVARWYDVQVVFKDDFSNTTLSGSISKFEKVSKLLDMLQTTGSLHYTIEGKKIILSK